MRYEVSGLSRSDWTSAAIDRSRYEEVRDAKKVCLFGVDLEEKLTLLLDNYAEYEVELLRLAEWSLIWPSREFTESMRERMLIDRRLVNFLTACRLYLDQTDNAICELFGKASPEHASLKKYKNDLHASHWGYRLMEALRDHAQHAGMPLGHLGYSAHMSEDRTYREITVVPVTRSKELAENDHLNPKVRAELREADDALDLRAPAREYVECLVLIHDRVRETVAAAVSDARGTYEAAAAEFSKIDGREVSVVRLVKMSEENDSIKDEIQIPTSFLSHGDELRKRNGVSAFLRSSVASNNERGQ